MRHYETRLQADLSAIQLEVGRIGSSVREAVDEAVRGLLARDRGRMYAVMLGDHPINRATRQLDQDIHAFVARHIPAAGHLRFVSSVLRLNIGLERIGDYSVTICRVGVQLEGDLPQAIQDDIRTLADQSSRMLELATRAFLKNDADLARDTAKLSKRVDSTHDRVFATLVEHSKDLSLMDIIRLQTIYDKLERVSDQAKNLCEEAVFVTTGETKQPKVYKVLFIDSDDSFLAPLTEGLARRAFPGSGDYTSVGLTAADAYDSRLSVLEDELQLDLGGPLPTKLAPLAAYPAEYHVIVALNLDYSELPEIPFHSALQRWELDIPEGDAPKGELVRDLNARLTDLMEKLRGDSAN